MKKSVLLLALAAMTSAFTGCSKEDVDAGMGNGATTPEATSGVLVANIASSDATRLAIGEGNTTLWSEGDRIALVCEGPSSNVVAFDIQADNVGQSSAVFTVGAEDADKWNSTQYLAMSMPLPELTQQVVAVYPYETVYADTPSGNFQEMARIGATIPATQNYVENSFDRQAMPMIAMTTRTEGSTGQDTFDPMTFIHMGALVKLQLSSAEPCTLDKIELTGTFPIAGRVVVDFSKWYMEEIVLGGLQNGTTLGSISGSGSLRMDGAGEGMVTLNGPIELSSEPKTVYISIMPWQHSSLNFTFYKQGEDAPYSRSVSVPYAIQAGDLVALQPLSLSSGKAPELKVDTQDPKVVTWQELEGVKSLKLTLMQNDKVVYSGALDSKATSVNIGDLPLSSVIAAGEVSFKLDVEYTQASSASASTTLTLDAPIIPVPTVSVDGNVVTITNTTVGYDELAWAYLEGADVTDESQFSDFTTEGIDMGVLDLSSLTPGDYSVCIRGNVGGVLVYTCVNVTVKEYTGPTYDVEITASVEGKVLTVTVTKGADLLEPYITEGTLELLISGFELGLYDGWTVPQQSFSVDLTDNLNFGDISAGTNTVQIAYFDWGTFGPVGISNEVSVNIQ